MKSIKSQSPDSFGKYLPGWLSVAKATLGVPQQVDRLHCWQFNCFTSHFPVSVSEPGKYICCTQSQLMTRLCIGLRFLHNPSFVFLTEGENISKPWYHHLADPTFVCDLLNMVQLQRLKPAMQLNGEIINTYHHYCCSQQPSKNNKTVVTTYVWPQLKKGREGHSKLTRMIFKALVGVFLFLLLALA
jgi:hypothetical protein